MKKLFLSVVMLSLGTGLLMAGWNTSPPSSALVGTNVTVSASGSANSGYNPLTYLVCWIQDPSGTWYHPVLGVGSNGQNISGSVTWTLNTAGTYHWQVTTTAGSPSGSTPYGTTWASATTQVNPAGPTQTTFSFSNLSFTYDGSPKTATVTPSPSNATYTADITKGPNAGSYTVTATATGNFTGSGSATLVINQAPASFAWSGGPTFTYDGSNKSVAVSVSPSGATYSQSGTWNSTNPGSYMATATAYGNYSGSSSYNWSIGPADPAPPAPSAAGYEQDYQYNNRNQLTAVKCADGTTLAAFSYQTDAQRSGRSLSNGTQTSYSYDAAGRLTQVQDSGILNQRYGRDLRDRRTWSLRDEGYGDTYEYLPDGELNRYRHQVWRPDQNFWNPAVWTDEFAYDSSGNRTSWNENGTVTSYQADSLNRYTSVTGATLAYGDGRGNLTQWQGWAYTYDADNRLTVAACPGTRVELYYDAEGRLMKLNRNGTWEYRYYDGSQCFERIDAGGGLIDWMVWGPSPDEALERYAPANGGWQYYHQDAVNSVVAVTGQSGNVLERYLYDPYGGPDIRDSAWNSRSTTAIGNPWLFTGQEWRDDIQLSNYKNRWYHSQLGRFLQNDPVRFDGGDLNLYRYASNDPFNGSDPSGLVEIYLPDSVGNNGDWWSQSSALATATIMSGELSRQTPQPSSSGPNNAENPPVTIHFGPSLGGTLALPFPQTGVLGMGIHGEVDLGIALNTRDLLSSRVELTFAGSLMTTVGVAIYGGAGGYAGWDRIQTEMGGASGPTTLHLEGGAGGETLTGTPVIAGAVDWNPKTPFAMGTFPMPVPRVVSEAFNGGAAVYAGAGPGKSYTIMSPSLRELRDLPIIPIGGGFVPNPFFRRR